MLATRIKEERSKKGISQASLAKIIGVSQQTIGSWETGRTSPDPDTIAILAKFFDITTDSLLGSTPAPSADERKKPKDLQKILEQHENLMFNGIPIDDEAKKDILHIVEFELYKRAKELNKRKKPKDGERSD